MDRENNVFYWLPCAVVFVSTAHEDRHDIMTANAMFVSEKEPLVLISVALNHLTEKLISQSGKFTLVIAGEGQKEVAMRLLYEILFRMSKNRVFLFSRLEKGV